MTADELIEAGYRLSTMKITSAKLTRWELGGITFLAVLEGDGCGMVLGGLAFRRWLLSAEAFSRSIKTMLCIMRFIYVAGAKRISDLNGKYVLVAHKGLGSSVKAIGNILGTKWFNPEAFFNE